MIALWHELRIGLAISAGLVCAYELAIAAFY
jgi:hypothetical protein